MRRNKVRLTESQLHRVIKESIRRVLNEGYVEYGFGSLTNDDNEYMNVYEAVVMINSDDNILKFTALATSEDEAIDSITKKAMNYSAINDPSDVEILSIKMVSEGQESPDDYDEFDGFGDDWDEEVAYGMEK